MNISTVLKSILHLDSQIQGPLISLGCMYSNSKAHIRSYTVFRLRHQSYLFNLGCTVSLYSKAFMKLVRKFSDQALQARRRDNTIT